MNCEMNGKSLKPTILIFDSGLGGLSVAKEIHHTIPSCTLIYVADNRIYPYGIKDDQTLLNRASELFPALESHYHPDIIVIACNSASTLVLDQVRNITHTPVVGVVPAIKPAAIHSNSGHIGLLATEGTISREYTDRLIADFAADCQILKVNGDALVAQAEKKLRGQQADMEVINDIITPLLANNPLLDTLILGCTHFPLIKDEIQDIAGEKIHLIDNSEAIARRTRYILETEIRTLKNSATINNTFIFTAETDAAHAFSPFLMRHHFSEMIFVDH